MSDAKVFNSIHIDLQKGIFELNGKPMEYVHGMELSAEDGRWSLRLKQDVIYIGTNGQKVMV